MKLKEIGNIISIFKSGDYASGLSNSISERLNALPEWSKKVVLSSKALSAEQKAAAAATMGLAAAEAGATGTTIGFGAALAGVAASAKAFAVALLSNPITWIVGAIGVAAVATYKQAHAFEDAAKSASEAQSTYASSANDLASLNSELETTSARIAELQELKDAGTITLTEESELAKLQRQNSELERQIALQQQLVSEDRKKSIQTAMDALEIKGTSAKTEDPQVIMTGQYAGSSGSGYTDIISATNAEISTLKKLKSERDVLYSQWENAQQGSKEKNRLQTLLTSNEKKIDEYTQSISDKVSTLSALRENFIDPITGGVYQYLTSGQEEMYRSLERTIDAYTNIDLSPVEKNLANIQSFFDGTTGKNAINDYILDMVKSGSTAEEAIKSLGLSLNDLGVSGAEDLNKYFNDLAKSASDAAEAVQQVDGTMSGVDAAFESGNKGDNLVKFSEYLTQAKELYDKGLTGTDDFKTVAALINNNVESSAKEFKKDYDRLKKYLTVDKEGNLTRSGIDKFASDLSKKLKEAGGSFESTADAADKLNISTEVLEMILGRMQDYDLSSFSKPIQDLVENLPRSAKSLAEAKNQLSLLKDLYDSIDDGETKKKLGEKLFNWEDEINKANSDLKSLDTDIVLEMKLEYDLAKIQAEIDEVEAKIAGGNDSVETQAESIALKKKRQTSKENQTKWNNPNIAPSAYTSNTLSNDVLSGIMRGTSDEKLRKKFQEKIRELYDISDVLQQSFMDSGLSLDEWINTDEAKTILIQTETQTDDILLSLINQGYINEKVIVDYICGDQEPPENMDAIMDYIMGYQDSPNDMMALVNYLKGIQDDPEAMEAFLDYLMRAQEDPDEKTALLNYIKKHQEKPDNLPANVDYQLGKQQSPIDKSAKVDYGLGHQAPPKNKTALVTYVARDIAKGSKSSANQSMNKWLSGNNFNGTAHSQGTAHSAYATGNWGLKKNETALINELGKELVVRNGKAFTLNNGYPTFARLKKGDIIFNHLQTEELLKKGYVTNSHARVFGSYASGTVDKISNAYASGSDDKQTVDWIERLLEKLERSIKRLQVVAESAFKTLKERTKANNNQIKQTASEIKYQQKSYDAYIKKANSVKLSSDLKKKVRDGSLNVKDYKGKTADLIAEYQEFYDKAQDCKDAIQELHESLAQLYQDNFDNLAKDYSNQLEQLESRTKLYEEYIKQSEARSYIGSVKYYEKLYSIEKDNISLLKKELRDLQNSQKQALDSGEIDKNSEAYYQMQSEINNVQLAIQESTTALLEYSNAMRELKWEYFDYEQERISALNDEAEFLVDLLSRSDLYDDKGNLTDEGNAVMGLHGQSYNTYMAQADAYAAEIKKINEEITNDPNNTALLERRQELLELQRESILAAEDEKDAMVELVEQGIEAQLDSMQELIDSYTDALDNAKDLYDYQKKIADQTSEIASLQKQLSAYENNTSEEARAKVQQIKVKLEEAKSNLEEAQYDKYVSDQKALLDDLYDEYEQALHQRLDNVDALISELIDGVNANSSTINDTLVSAAGEVGYTMTSEMQSVWNSANDVLHVYGDDFSGQLTSVNSVLNTISNSVSQLVQASDERYKKDVLDTASMNTVAVKPNSSSSSNKNTSSSSTQSSSSSNVFIKKKYNGNKSKLDKENSVVDRLKYFDFDASMSARKQYYKKLGLGSDYSGTASQNAKLLKKMKSIGYSKGGFVADLQKIAVSNGDDIVTINTLKRGEAVLTPEQAAQFKKLVSYFPDISEFIDFSKYISTIPIDSIGAQVGDISIAPYFNILIDHVEDYNDFVTKLQHDKQFEKMVRAMSVDLLAGGNTLAKNKFKWH